jgi:hypothetical protein
MSGTGPSRSSRDRFGEELAHVGDASTHVSERTRWMAAMGLVACVPVVAGVLYFSLGNPRR